MFNLLSGDVTPPLYTTPDGDGSPNPLTLILIIFAIVAIIVTVICFAVARSNRGKDTDGPTTQKDEKTTNTEFENLSEEEKQLLREHREHKFDQDK